MKNVLNKIKIISLCFMLLIPILCLTGCYSGIVSEEQYNEIFDGVNAEDYDGNSVYYQMRTLVDNTKFNTQIQSKPYCKLDIYLKQSCQIRAMIFLVRSSENCTLKFTTFIDGENICSITKDFSSNISADVDLVFTDTKSCNSRTNFYIEIEELNKEKDEPKTSFQFDSLIIFLQE